MSQVGETFSQASARGRITRVVEAWFLTEPLLFTAWTMHDIVEQPGIETIRVGRGKIEFNPQFIRSLRRSELREVLEFEAMRILLGHPYARRQSDAELSYAASNVTVQECLHTHLPVPSARDLFGREDLDDQYFELYYRELAARSEEEPDDQPPEPSSDSDDEQDDADSGSGADATEGDSEDSPDNSGSAEPMDPESDDSEDSSEQEESGTRQSQSADSGGTDLDAYTDPKQVGMQNTQSWDADDLLHDEITAAVREAAETDGWGTVGGSAKESLLATLSPKLDYRGVLRNFRQSVLSVRRRLTRMKPSRRYGLDQMGSRYEFTTKLLFAVDVSGSMTERDLRLGFSVVSRFFRYGVEAIDVIWFDTAIRGEPITLRRARSAFEVTGRGGTDFGPVIRYIDETPGYDGLIVFTDGYAAVPPKPTNRRTRVLWLFKDETTYQRMHESLRPIGRSAFLQEAAASQ